MLWTIITRFACKSNTHIQLLEIVFKININIKLVARDFWLILVLCKFLIDIVNIENVNSLLVKLCKLLYSA